MRGSDYMALSSESKQVIKVKWVNDSRSWSNISTAKKSLFPSNWTDEDIADALKQAEDLLKTWNNWKLAMRLDEATFIDYCIEWGLDTTLESFENWILQTFRNWWEIQLWEFWINFERHVYIFQGINIKIWSKYLNWGLVQEVNTIFPK